MRRALTFVAAFVVVFAFEYATLVWLSGPYECVNCDPE